MLDSHCVDDAVQGVGCSLQGSSLVKTIVAFTTEAEGPAQKPAEDHSRVK